MEGTQLFSYLSCWSGLGAAEPVSVMDVQVTGDDDIVVGGVHLIQSIIQVLKERDIMTRARARSDDQMIRFLPLPRQRLSQITSWPWQAILSRC